MQLQYAVHQIRSSARRMASAAASSKIRILVLHGFFDSAENRQHQMRTLTRSMKDMEFVFVNSPFPFVNYGFVPASEALPADPRYQWFSYRPEWSVLDYSYDVIQESVAFIIDYIVQHGPFHGLLGFSQGAIVAVATLLQIPHWPCLPDCVKFVILVGCPSINDPTLKSTLETLHQKKTLPTLHVSGTKDTLIPPAVSETLFKRFPPPDAEFYLHKGGHYCPSDTDFRGIFRDFIQRAMHP